MPTVYMTTNIINGKRYIGRDMHDNPNYLGSGSILKKAIKKYGRDNFKKEVLQNCLSIDELIEAEQYWISFYNASVDSTFYNILTSSTGGDSLSNHPELESIKQKIRIARSKQKIHHSKETRKKIGDSQRGQLGYWYKRFRPIEMNEKVSAALKGKPKRKIQCPHCKRIGGDSQMKRWHFDNCILFTGKPHTSNKSPWNKGKTKMDYPQMSNSGAKKGNIPWNKSNK